MIEFFKSNLGNISKQIERKFSQFNGDEIQLIHIIECTVTFSVNIKINQFRKFWKAQIGLHTVFFVHLI